MHSHDSKDRDLKYDSERLAGKRAGTGGKKVSAGKTTLKAQMLDPTGGARGGI